MRLACIYALLDLSGVVRAEHLHGGVGVVGVCRAFRGLRLRRRGWRSRRRPDPARSAKPAGRHDSDGNPGPVWAETRRPKSRGRWARCWNTSWPGVRSRILAADRSSGWYAVARPRMTFVAFVAYVAGPTGKRRAGATGRPFVAYVALVADAKPKEPDGSQEQYLLSTFVDLCRRCITEKQKHPDRGQEQYLISLLCYVAIPRRNRMGYLDIARRTQQEHKNKIHILHTIHTTTTSSTSTSRLSLLLFLAYATKAHKRKKSSPYACVYWKVRQKRHKRGKSILSSGTSPRLRQKRHKARKGLPWSRRPLIQRLALATKRRKRQKPGRSWLTELPVATK